ncbi:type II toxin-antitoxin system VapC family toxin [Rhizobium rhizogenes]|uniref:type II toxin-antitoxin system VapC family toxin n=1 Tax=Rhizobium TaxID=379 RepID=UPI00026ED2A4|nr:MULTISPECIES: type II toxin-antitoxin system VapC family toxin [Rhizobium]OCJ21929.1 twitching motility protein PilT [Agrobacterium sp. B131/95]EJK80082.1 putative nucleic-acid-binding protein, contains PIN domain [Rhizobium sp. AP16]MDJ1637314.1 type II toxin-antitoxin system VapC family toxin [Rhizobium rhizogenes]NTH11245.1 type II toxin-antitoxin system VapC family toxin [Rhizobium rhizogenes]NTI21239.1 type II toxin-antitoxin system VapC family toxin [Rhizobium rhizogenes]
MIAIDTNLIVRYLTGDHPEQSPSARGIVDGQAIFVAATVVLEVEWVLRSTYGYRPTDVARALRAFGGLPTVTVEDAALVAAALELAEKGMDFADALHLGRSAHCEGFVTFDRKLVKVAKAVGYESVREA